mmetsp:Transcript_4704/g.7828  ORF Transcript_4704/g.7828 Transcript_4704/m.7828 type:complete len:120 (-) Transcript_4704:4-363(-)
MRLMSVAWHICSTKPSTSLRFNRSSPWHGSSSTNSCGRDERAEAIRTIFCSPCESSEKERSNRSSICNAPVTNVATSSLVVISPSFVTTSRTKRSDRLVSICSSVDTHPIPGRRSPGFK